MASDSRVFSVALTLMALSFISIFAVAVGCQDAGVGRPCCTAGPGKGSDCVNSPEVDNAVRGMEGTSIVDNDLKCPSRICAWVQPQQCSTNATSAECAAAVQVPPAGSMPGANGRVAECTTSCNEDGDCPEGYLCARPVRVAISPAFCRAFCIRREYLPVVNGQPETTPPECVGVDGGAQPQPMTPDVATQ